VRQPGPTGPDFYDDLRREMAAEGEQLAGQAEPPPPEGPTVEGLREDNAQLVEERHAQQDRERREARREDIYRECEETTRRQVEQANGFGDVATRFETLGQNAADLVEERYLDRHDGKPNPNDPYLKALREGPEDDPAEAMRRAAIADDIAFMKQYERYDRRIAEALDADTRRSLEQQQEVFAENHLAEVQHRIADGEEILTGSGETEEAVERRELAAEHEDQATKAQESYRARTGRDARVDGLNDEAAARAETSGGADQSEALSGDWAGAGTEVTDRLTELEGRFPGGSGPSRPNDGGGRTY
jgi:hypothetical protein